MEELVVSIRAERRWPLQAALAVAILWLVVIVIGVAAQPQAVPAMLAAALPPVGLALVAYALLAGSSRPLPLGDVEARLLDAQSQVASLEAALHRVDIAVAGTSGQMRHLASADLPGVIANVATLEATTRQMTASGDATNAAVSAMLAAMPDIARTVASVGDTLRDVGGDSATQLRAVETMLAAVHARNHEAATAADMAIADMSALLARIDDASTRNTEALSKRAYALDAAIDGVLERSATVVGTITEHVDVTMRGFSAGIETAARQMAMFGDDGARLFNQRLEALLKTSTLLKSEFASHDASAALLHEATTRRADEMQRRFAELDAAGIATAEDVAARIAAFQDRLATLQGQLDAAKAALVAMDDQSCKFGETVAGVHTTLAGKLAETGDAMGALDGEARHMLDAVVGLGLSVRDSTAAVQTAAETFAAEREAMTGLAARLATHFDTARETLAAIREGSSAATTEAAAAFDGELARMQSVAADAAAGMRRSLATIVDDAMAALELAATTGTDAAFGEPVRAQLAAIGDATARAADTGQEMSRRLAGQMLGLVEAVAAAEARASDVETRFAVRERHSMAAQAIRIMTLMDAALIDVTRLLVLPIGEDEWAGYLRGDRGAYARAVVPQLDGEMLRRVARLFRHDDDFRASAATYMQGFENLINCLLGDRDGEALAATLLSSDNGKIYVVLAEAAGRLPPTRAP